MNPIIFVHIPKTAGTSFRNSLAKIYNEKSFLQDYGKKSRETSLKVLQEVYLKRNTYGLLDEQLKVIGGHFPVQKYINISELKKIATFVREPVSRVVSEFRHKQRIDGYKGSLLEFAEMPINQNVIARYLNSTPIEALGFVGVAEKYVQSLELFNRFHGLKVKAQHLNSAIEANEKYADIDSKDSKRLTALNTIDIAIYNASVTNIEWRHRLDRDKMAYVHGMWRFDKKTQKITGYAFSYNSEIPVRLSFCNNGEVIAEVVANSFFALIHRFRGPRRGYVGFSFDTDIVNETGISCQVMDSGQAIMKMLEY